MVSKKKQKKVGIVMPISTMDDLKEQHWLDVKLILEDACKSIEEYDVVVDLVSNDETRDIIHSKIVYNLFESDVVICDVSKKNPNVMFELGMRLAFDKPIIIVKDNSTDFSFDTSIIKHIIYPRTLRHSEIEDFKKTVKMKVISLIENVETNSYISYFKDSGLGTISVPDIQAQSVPVDKYIINELKNLSSRVSELNRKISFERDNDSDENGVSNSRKKIMQRKIGDIVESGVKKDLYPLLDKYISDNGTDHISLSELSDFVYDINTPLSMIFSKKEIENYIATYLRDNNIDYLPF
jgi:hypothetical protein